MIRIFAAGLAALAIATPGCSDGDENGDASPSELHAGSIVFDNDTEDVWRVAADGSQLRRLTTDAAQEFDPSWSSDGGRVAYRSEVDGNSEIYVMHADGTHARNLTKDAASDYSPSWSPTGNQIAFASDRGGGRNDIYVMDADGSHVRRVTTDLSIDEYPTWSPDGSRLAFVSDRDGRWEIYVINANGTTERRLTRSGGKLPSWSPDGSWIAFEGPTPKRGSRAREFDLAYSARREQGSLRGPWIHTRLGAHRRCANRRHRSRPRHP
jgi:Tol biopolymer transport system component